MAFSYSENLANFEQWTYRQSFVDDSSWMSSIQETETLTKALQQSFSSDYYSSEETLLPVHHQQFVKPEQPIPTTTTTTPTVSGSDPETTSTTTTLKQQRRGNNNHQTLKGKISKRKSRATNRSPITFITADPMNFRQMVQQVTGIRIGGGGANGGGEGDLHLPVTQIMKPEAKRPGDLRLMNGGYTLPTLDTSAFLLEQQLQQQQQQQLMGSTTSSTVTSPTHVVSYHSAPVVVAQVNTGFDFDTFQSFPTLESWGVI